MLNAVHFVKESSKTIWEDNFSPDIKNNRPKPIEKITKKGFSVDHYREK